jgi:hypothetical protein
VRNIINKENLLVSQGKRQEITYSSEDRLTYCRNWKKQPEADVICLHIDGDMANVIEK